MKFKFTIQDYQTEAVESVIKVFKGQPLGVHEKISDEEMGGFANSPVTLSRDDLLSNIREVQGAQITNSNSLARGLGKCSLDIEMETGTGKTYVYIKTIFELNKIYGWKKFIIVVPSIAIREGVKKNFDSMEDHFMEQYGKKARYFVYDSKKLSEIDNFDKSSELYVMIINIQAFNVRTKDARKINVGVDEIRSLRPIDIIKSNRPIIILDEPQKMGGTATQESLENFNPLFSLNYSATHKQHHNLIYVLDTIDAFNKKLVKKITVIGIDLKNLHGTDGYLFLREIVIAPDKPPRAKLEFEIKYKNSIKRETKLINVNDDLYSLSKDLQEYCGYRVSEIDPVNNTLSFINGVKITAGDMTGDISEKDLRRAQIRETIHAHLEKEKILHGMGIKCLSLFFIDKVENYRKYNEDGVEINSEYGEIFEEEYNAAVNEYIDGSPYGRYLSSINTAQTHAGYFSIDKKGHKVDSAIKKGSDESDDISAYDLILKDKERLLSFETPVRFIFPHSALREGWDNPNIFQICTLKRGGSSITQKRQEVGRGLRLCVNQDGDRMDFKTLENDFHNINSLTLIASEGYKTFVQDLQKGILEDLYERPKYATEEYFKGRKIKLNGQEIIISDMQARDIYRYLIENKYIDANYFINNEYREAAENNSLATLPASCQEIGGYVHKLIQSLLDPNILNEIIKDGRDPEIKDNPLNKNFYREEFQRLWSLIEHKYVYIVKFNNDELVQKAIENINKNLMIARLQYTITRGAQNEELNYDKIKDIKGFEIESTSTEILQRSNEIQTSYDLIGRISKATQLSRKTIGKILSGLNHEVFQKFYEAPEEFIKQSIELIQEEKTMTIIDHITYNQSEDRYIPKEIFAEKHGDYNRAYHAKRNVQDYIFLDGYARDGRSVERKMAESLDTAEEVCVYAKMPHGFYIPTPVGNYSPDWAIVFKEGTVKHIFFIAETKGSTSSLNLRRIEQIKIECAKKLFAGLSEKDILYDTVDNYQKLLELMKN